MKTLKISLALLLATLSFTALLPSAQADWARGHWSHDRHYGHLGWWWVGDITDMSALIQVGG